MEPEDREFMRELLLRHEKATDAMIARLDAGTREILARIPAIRAETQQVLARTAAIQAETQEVLARTAAIQAETATIREGTDEVRANTYATADALRAHTREFVAEMRAQRQALFRTLDRLDGGGASANA